MKLPLTIVAGTEWSYLRDANGECICRSIASDETSLKELSLLACVANALPRALENEHSLKRRLRLANAAAEKHHASNRAACKWEGKLKELFNAMPDQPDDIESPEGLTAYVEALALWRAQCELSKQ